MMWGSFYGNKKVLFVFVSPGQKKVIENIHKKHLILFSTQVDPNHKLKLREDNIPTHNACASKALLAKKAIRKIEWPAQSTNLNPIENIWFILKSNIQQQAWTNFPTSTPDHLIESIPKQIHDVIRAEGGATRWYIFHLKIKKIQ